jgi:hypothetical protein
VTGGLLARALLGGLPEEDARALTFATLVIGDLGLILANRASSGSLAAALRTRNTALWLVVGGAALLLGVVIVVPGLQTCSVSVACTRMTSPRSPVRACWPCPDWMPSDSSDGGSLPRCWLGRRPWSSARCIRWRSVTADGIGYEQG